MKKILLAIAAGLINLHVYSQTVDFELAKNIASSFLTVKKGEIQKSNQVVSSQYTIYGESGNPLLYIINFERNGFVIVSANQSVEPVLAYSTDSKFPFDGTNPAAEDWARAYAEGIAHAVETKLVPSDEIKSKWSDAEKGIFPTKEQKSGTTLVGPLLTSKWNQDRYYNEHCPDTVQSSYMSAYDNRTPNGCVAVAMAQIMYYHRYPKKGVGSSNYNCNGYGKLYANYATANYNYEAMSDVATGYSGALAQLIYHAGVSVKMNYKADGSGAYSEEVRVALSARFSYKTSLRYWEQRNFDDFTWKSFLKTDLNRGLPVYYSGCNGTTTSIHGCHAFVCDGYNDGEDKFHFNWGWGGNSDGWFTLSNMGYILNCGIISGIEPPTTESNFFSGTKVLTAGYGSFTDGSPSQGEYKNNTNCSWLIAPQNGENVTAISLKIAYFSTEDNNDIVTIYKGDTINPDSVVVVLSGNLSETSAIPLIYSSKAFVTFTSNANITAKGFKFNYTSQRKLNNYCPDNSSPTVLTESAGSIESTPENTNYDDANICYWAIKPKNEQKVGLVFTKFDMGQGDFVDIYAWDGIVGFSKLNYYKDGRYRFTKEEPPVAGKEYLVSAAGAYIRFRTDNNLNASGFTLNWYASNAVQDLPTGISYVNIYPNPARDNVKLQVEMLNPESLQLSIYNMVGEEVYRSKPMEMVQQYNQNIDVSGLAKGIYHLKITTSKGIIAKKITVL